MDNMITAVYLQYSKGRDSLDPDQISEKMCPNS